MSVALVLAILLVLDLADRLVWFAECFARATNSVLRYEKRDTSNATKEREK